MTNKLTLKSLRVKIRKQRCLVDSLTIRLVECPLDDFEAIQTELFKQQTLLKTLENARDNHEQ